jgi:hypothetical protein
MPTSATQLDALLQQSLKDKTAERAFFRALLDATVYVHAPISDDSRNLRLIQFTRPDGLTVLPFFSNSTQATAATGNAVRVVPLMGRVFLEATRGATLMLNPNGIYCTLYPEEIAALLDKGEVAAVEMVDVPKSEFLFGVPDPTPSWLIEPLVKLYAQLACVQTAYLIEARPSNDPDHPMLLIALTSSRLDAERAARATITAIQPLCRNREVGVDITSFDPATEGTGWIDEIGIEPFYERSAAGN